MARIPIVALSAGSAFVLFLGTSVGLLAAQGRLGNLMGKPAEHGADDPTSQPSEGVGDPAESGVHGTVVKPDAAGGHDGSKVVKGGKGAESKAPADAHGKAGAEPVKVDNESANQHDGSHDVKQDVKRASAAPIVKRVATASLVQNFKLPEPFTAHELEELVAALKENRESHSRLTDELAAQKSATDRDRLDLEARFSELDETRKKLEQQKIEVSAKVAELAKRNDQLTSGEEKYIKATVARLSTLKVDEAKAQLLILDDALAARVLHKMEPKFCAKILVSLPAEKSVALTKLLRSISLAETEPAGAVDTKENKK